MARLDPQPGEVIDRSRHLSFQFDGESHSAHPGDTIASALAASGTEIFSRSFKYHRPRGLLCVAGKCPNCLVNLNGIPNVRACTQPVEAGDRVTSQHRWPSLGRDLLSLIEKFDRYMPVGFYYKALYTPRLAWRMVEPLVRRLAGLGKLEAPPEKNGHRHGQQEHLHAQVMVIGGGPAGLSAALAASQAGAQVLLVDDQPQLGGHLRYQARPQESPTSDDAQAGFEIARQLAKQVQAETSIQILSPAVAFGGYEGKLIGVAAQHRLYQVRFNQLVLASGCYQYPDTFENNDLPGILLGSGLKRLIHLYGVRPGQRAVVVTNQEQGLEMALELDRLGIPVAAVVDSRPQPANPENKKQLDEAGVPYLAACVPLAAEGRRRVQALTVAPRDVEGRTQTDQARRLDCDLVCLLTHQAPSLDLLRQTGGSVVFDPELGQMVASRVPEDLHLAGDVTGLGGLPLLLAQGERAGLGAAGHFRPLTATEEARLEQLRNEIQQLETSFREAAGPMPNLDPEAPQGKAKQFICLCEDVTRRDVANAIAEGFGEVELLKRYTTASMGPCQGRMCLMPLASCCAEQTGRTLVETGTTTSRPPAQPISLRVLAGPQHHPIRLTPMHHQHLRAGARQMDMGEWKRPFSYLTPEVEWRAVRERVGLIDLSTLGKLEVQGADAPQLLDLVYTHIFSTLKVGRIRYGMVCGDDGIILDDGTVSRLAPDRYYITTTSGNIEFVEAWMQWWIDISDLCAHVTNVTSDFAAVNVAGPRARELLQKMTDIDLGPDQFRYMQCAEGEVAGVPSRLLRIGFVGEAGWEVHVPWCYGEYLWETLMEAGQAFDILPFGVEAQRILRLEKKHLIVGQDTDSLSNPLEADMGWVVKFDKPDFVGRAMLASVRDRGLQNRLVGFITDRLVAEGSAVVLDQKPVGRVTSARISPGEDRCVGMAWVPEAVSGQGDRFQIHQDGQLVSAQVYLPAFYDPSGKRLRG